MLYLSGLYIFIFYIDLIYLLKTKCLSLLREKTREVLVDPDFEDLSESTVLSIVKDDALNINELELFDAVIRWAKIQCTRREYEIKRTTMRHVTCIE